MPHALQCTSPIAVSISFWGRACWSTNNHMYMVCISDTIEWYSFIYFCVPLDKEIERNTNSLKNRTFEGNNGSQMINPSVSTQSWTKYGIWRDQIETLHMCLNALNLTRYYRALNYMSKAETNVIQTLQNYLHLLEPSDFKTEHNHCYHIRARLNMNSTHLSGFIRSHPFEQNTSNMDSFVLRSLRARFKTNYRHFFTYACLPKVFLAGFPKCGSTYLHEILESHPHVSRSVIKEPHQWDRIPASPVTFRALTAYFTLYMYNYSPLDIENSRTQVAIDSSPQTVSNWPRFQGENWRINICLPPVILPALIPKIKFVIVMRNPVAATYSLFWFTCTHHNGTVPRELLESGPLIFHDRVTTKISAFKQCQNKYPIAKCMMDMRLSQSQQSEAQHCGTARMDVFMYYVHIQKWLAVYPRKQFMFLTLEELSGKYTGRVAGKVWRFIGVSPKAKIAQRFSHPSNEQHKVDYHHNPHWAMRQDTKDILEEFFRPFNILLSELLGDAKFLWNENFVL